MDEVVSWVSSAVDLKDMIPKTSSFFAPAAALFSAKNAENIGAARDGFSPSAA
jgi:hypothetical protein